MGRSYLDATQLREASSCRSAPSQYPIRMQIGRCRPAMERSRESKSTESGDVASCGSAPDRQTSRLCAACSAQPLAPLPLPRINGQVVGVVFVVGFHRLRHTGLSDRGGRAGINVQPLGACAVRNRLPYADHEAFWSTTRYPSGSSKVRPARSQYGLNDGTG